MRKYKMIDLVVFNIPDSTIIFMLLLNNNIEFKYKYKNGKHLFEFKERDYERHCIDDALNLVNCELMSKDKYFKGKE